MGNVVYKLTSKEIQSLMAQTTFETTKLPQGMKARTRYQDTVINIYSSGKVMFQGKNAEQVARVNCWQSTTGKHTSSNTTSIQYNHFHCIGSDEAGSGDYFGPLTVCAAYVPITYQNLKRTWC